MSVSFEMVREMALALDDVVESTSYGTPAFKVKGKLFVRLHQDLESLVIRMDMDQREDFIALDPETFYITDHYKDYEWLLVRMSKVKPSTLRELLNIARNLRAPVPRRQAKSRKK